MSQSEVPANHAESADELLRSVDQWAEDLRAHIRWHLKEAAEHPGHPVPLTLLYLAEQTVEGLSDRAFRESYARLLAGSPRAGVGHFMASNAAGGRQFIRELGVVEIIPVQATAGEPSTFPGNQFPRPVVHHRSRNPRAAGSVEPENIRLLLNHIAFLGWHPQYLLVCTRCGWPQGALATAEAYASDVPHPCDQAREWWDRSRSGFDDEAGQFTLDRIISSFSEEVWGLEVIKTPADRLTPLIRRPVSGEIGKVLDEVFFGRVPEWWPRKEELAAAWRERRDLLAQLLSALTCQVCGELGHLRYMPRLLFPIDADLTVESQAETLTSVARLFVDARERLEADPAIGGVLWIPMPFPRLRLSELAQRFELRHEDRTPPAERVPNLWLVALWLLDVASASSKRPRGKRAAPGKYRSRDRRMTWEALFDEVGAESRNPGGSAVESLDLELSALRRRIDQLIGTGQERHRLVFKVRDLLESPEYVQGSACLARYFQDEKLSDDLAQYRFRIKSTRGAMPINTRERAEAEEQKEGHTLKDE